MRAYVRPSSARLVFASDLEEEDKYVSVILLTIVDHWKQQSVLVQ